MTVSGLNVSRIYRACTFDRLSMVLVCCVVALATALSPVPADTWWHLRAGADMIRSHHVLLTDTYSHTAYGLPWPNHEWLSQIVFYALYRVGGLPLLALFAAAVTTSAWCLVWLLAAGPSMRRFIIVALVLFPASLHWAPRPQALSLLFLMATVTLIARQQSFWLPVVFVIWANTHGAVLLGLIVMTAGFSATLIDNSTEWRRYAAIGAGCIVATTLTPLGLSFWAEIPRSLGRIRLYPIDEWRRPLLTEGALLPFWIAVAALCVGVASRWRTLLSPCRRQARLLCVSALAILPLAVTAIRNVGPFLMIAAPALCWLATATPPSGTDGNERERRTEHPAVNISAMAVVVGGAVFAIITAYRANSPHLRWTPLPVSSLEALRKCPNNLYNRYDEGGYLIWFAPERRVFIDGRQDPYPSALIFDQIRIEHSGDYQSTFDRFHIHCAYLPTVSPVAVRLRAAGWSSLYSDLRWIVLADPRTFSDSRGGQTVASAGSRQAAVQP